MGDVTFGTKTFYQMLKFTFMGGRLHCILLAGGSFTQEELLNETTPRWETYKITPSQQTNTLYNSDKYLLLIVKILLENWTNTFVKLGQHPGKR